MTKAATAFPPETSNGRSPSDKPTILAYKLPKRRPGQGSVAIKIGNTTFKCIPELDGITLLEFANTLNDLDLEDEETGEDEEEKFNPDTLKAISTLLDMLKIALVDYDEFRKFFAANGLGLDFLTDIIGDLIGAYMSRPTEQPSGS